MKSRIVAISALLAALLSLTIASGLRGQQPADDEGVTLHMLPAPPPLRDVSIGTEGDDDIAPRTGTSAATRMTGLAPPPARACISDTEFDTALRGTGCSCTCEEYARKPVSRTCDVACQGYYACWGPQITDAELDQELKKIFGGAIDAGIPLPQLASEEREMMRGAIRATRGQEWSNSRMCRE